MGKQHNKVEKRRRRVSYLKRKKTEKTTKGSARKAAAA
jgi:ribosomal protein S15P/S13E